MKLFNRNTDDERKPLWRYDAGTLLWRILPDNAGRIVGEARNPDSRVASFFCLRESDGTPIWQGRRMDEDWWVGIDAVAGGMIFFHRYAKPDMPQHLGIIACDVATGEELWREPALTFMFHAEGSVYASEQRFAAQVFHRLDAATGQRLEELGGDPIAINRLRATLNEDDYFENYRYPEPYTPAHPDWARCCSFVKGFVDPAAVVGNLDLLEWNDIITAAWHLPNESGGLTQHFVISRADDGAPLFRETMVDHADAPGMDSFFIKDDLLLYVRNRSILTAHDVAGVDT